MNTRASDRGSSGTPSSDGWLWFLGSLVRVQVPSGASSDGMSVIEHHVRQGDSPPMHVHEGEAEVFRVLEGGFRVHLDGREFHARAGDAFSVPPGAAHTYRVESEQGGVFLTITRGPFEAFVREVARPAERVELPAGVPPSAQDMERLAAVAARHGIRFVGPPLAARAAERLR